MGYNVDNTVMVVTVMLNAELISRWFDENHVSQLHQIHSLVNADNLSNEGKTVLNKLVKSFRREIAVLRHFASKKPGLVADNCYSKAQAMEELLNKILDKQV